MSQATPYIVRTFPVGPLQCNCTVIGDPATRRALVIDPGGNAADIQAILAELQLVIVAIIHTHAHLDHILRDDLAANMHQLGLIRPADLRGTAS
jgi:glyoxylase-like metal-dependent hydrolase (beta-lactamase superfamily II)